MIFLDAKLVCLNNAPLDGDTGHLGHLAQTLAKKDSKHEYENARLVLTILSGNKFGNLIQDIN